MAGKWPDMVQKNPHILHSMRQGLSFRTHIVRVHKSSLRILWGRIFTNCVVLVVVVVVRGPQNFPTFSSFSLKSSATARALRALAALENIPKMKPFVIFYQLWSQMNYWLTFSLLLIDLSEVGAWTHLVLIYVCTPSEFHRFWESAVVKYARAKAFLKSRPS